MRIRFTFAKQGALRYTGHLDLHTLLERAIRRAGLPLAYSQGFHPTPKIQLAAALPLGFSSRAEMMDVWLTEDREIPQLHNDLQASLPGGIQLLHAEQVEERAPALQTRVIAAEYEVTLPEGNTSELSEKVSHILEASSLARERRGKPYDLRPLIEELKLYQPETRIFMRLTARESATGRPEEVLAELGIPVETAHVERTRLIFQG